MPNVSELERIDSEISCGACTVGIGAHTELYGRCRKADQMWLVHLLLQIGDTEKTSIHLVKGADQAEAELRAALDECHDEDRLEQQGEWYYDHAVDFAYRPYFTTRVDKADVDVLVRLGMLI